ncbi:MAG: aminoglycoside phosphotransferase, partial [Candidatus Heimdallarchaeota archaeon]|nr:aminoglycoside phosphotransferase [Candidatus Heimdallarchaeota archaeon]
IEFNEMLRIQDILEEVAFLSMDFDFHGKQEYSKQFIELYLKNMNEDIEENLKLLEFYKSYRAYVRAKVYYSLALQDKTEVQKKNHKELALAYMKLASSYEF